MPKAPIRYSVEILFFKALKTKDWDREWKMISQHAQSNQCIQKWGLKYTVNFEQSTPVYFMEFKHPQQYEMMILLQLCVWLSKSVADTVWWYQPYDNYLQGWPVMGF